MPDDRKTSTAMMIIFVFIIIASQWLEAPAARALGMPPAPIGNDPPWHYIQSDFVRGIVGSMQLAAVLLVCVIGWRFASRTATSLAMVATIFSLPPAIMSGIIYFRCPGLLGGEERVSAWPTFDAYSADRTDDWLTLLVGAGVILPLVVSRWMARKKKAQTENSSAGS
jgi:hypothetical protein